MSNIWGKVSFYQDVHRLRRDAEASVARYPSLSPVVQSFNQQGKVITLFLLQGTVPINFQGNQYNIPITVFFDPPYPTRPPRFFVTPTANMSIKPNHPHVDKAGFVFHPYLSGWNPYNSGAAECLANLVATFSGMPPVYAMANSPIRILISDQAFNFGPTFSPTIPPNPVAASGMLSNFKNSIKSAFNGGEEKRQQLNKTALTMWPTVASELTRQLDAQLDFKEELDHRFETAVRRRDAEIPAMWSDYEADITTLQRAVASESEELEKLKSNHSSSVKRDPKVSDVVVSPDAASAQVLELVSQEAALNDVMDALEEALKFKKISVEEYVNNVREIARDLFFVKKTLQKSVTQFKVHQHNQQHSNQQSSITTPSFLPTSNAQSTIVGAPYSRSPTNPTPTVQQQHQPISDSPRRNSTPYHMPPPPVPNQSTSAAQQPQQSVYPSYPQYPPQQQQQQQQQHSMHPSYGHHQYAPPPPQNVYPPAPARPAYYAPPAPGASYPPQGYPPNGSYPSQGQAPNGRYARYY